MGQYAANGWRRREIIIRQTSSGYPQIGQRINLYDSIGISLGALSFIKGAKLGWTCLGKPGLLQKWFEERYPFDRVKAEPVYFVKNQREGQYRIYGQSEWEHEKMAAEERSDKYVDYWSSFDAFLRDGGVRFRRGEPPNLNYYNFSICLPNTKLQPLIRFTRPDIGIDLYVLHPNAKQIFDCLKLDRASIEAEFGEPLIWRLTDKGFIIQLRTNLDPSEKNSRVAQYTWLLDRLHQFRTVFTRRRRVFR